MKNIAIFCGSSTGTNPIYSSVAKELARLFYDQGLSMITGGGRVGIMGVLADEMIKCGGKVIGVIPDFLVEKEVAHQGLSEIIVVNTMHERKKKIEELSDGFIALPGGFGTLDEIFEMITWAQLDIHRKPCGILNINGYFDHLIAHIEHMVQEGYVANAYLGMVIMDTDPKDILERMITYSRPILDKAKIALGEKK